MASKHPKFQIELAKNGQFYWRLRGRNGQIVATSHESFTRRRDAVRAVNRIEDLIFDHWPIPTEVA